MKHPNPTPKPDCSRRDFLKHSLTAGALLGFPTVIPSRALGKDGAVAPSNRVTIGVIGCGARSRSCNAYNTYPKSEIVAVCDPFLGRRQHRASEWGVADHYADFRDVLAREDIDAVHIVTPDHWHVPIALAAAKAGKDIYCEKPLGLTLEQDFLTRRVVDTHHRVFQYGTQQRSMDRCRMALEIVLNGHLGEIEEVFVWAPPGRSTGAPTIQPIPENLDYDLFLGPAPQEPYSPQRTHMHGSWFIYDYSIGFLGGWGAHPLDLLQFWADQENIGIPVDYAATGTIPAQGLYDTVQFWQAECTYANGMRLHFMDADTATAPGSPLPTAETGPRKQRNGTLFMGTKGWLSVSRGNLDSSLPEMRRLAREPGPVRLPVSRDHFGNFVDAVISREQPISPLDSAIRSDTISHLVDIAIRTGGSLTWDPIRETIVGDPEAVRRMSRPMREPWTLENLYGAT